MQASKLRSESSETWHAKLQNCSETGEKQIGLMSKLHYVTTLYFYDAVVIFDKSTVSFNIPTS